MRESVAKQIHEKAAPIVAWLRTAEEESSGEEEDEDEVEVVYSERAGNKGITTITEKPPQPKEEVRKGTALVKESEELILTLIFIIMIIVEPLY